MNSNRNDEIEIDFWEILMILRRRMVGIIAATIVCAVLTGIISVYFVTPMYTAVSKIYILTSDSMVNLSDLQMGSSLAEDYTEVIQIRPVIEKVAENLKLDMTYEQLLDCISITNPTDTRIIRIQVTYKDPVMAKEIANEISEVSRAQIVEIMKVEEPTIMETAVVPEKQSSPNNVKNIMLGALLGLVVSVAVAIFQYILDDTIKTSEDIEKYLGMNMLASVPEEGGTDNSEKKEKGKLRGIRRWKS
ncbi:MAG: hypothetical protein IJA36_05885 [Lachnospiraceae bacterium]|nr:hypothetical protein [Lachnospiraceae bacterium]